MELTIHLYGYAHHMFNTLNAIAMFRNSALYPATINTMALMVAAYYAIRMAGSRAEGEWRQYLMKIGGMLLLINALLLPKTSMNIKDHVAKQFWRVDNIPVAFALPIGMLEELGHLVTIGFEQSFSAVGGRSAFNYYNHGTVFGARLAKEVLQVHVRNPEFTSNMHGFIRRCVMMPAMIGSQFTKEELVATKDMWGLVSKNAGSLTRTPMTINGTRQVPSPTCKQAVPYFEKAMADSMKTDITAISIKLKTAGEGVKYNPSHLNLNKALESQISALYNNNSSVSDILKHNMMINSLNNYRAAKYPAVKAQLQHEANGFQSGSMAERVLTGLQGVFKNLVYGSFIFVFPLMLLAGGMAKYRGWLTICLSLQLWPPLFAMLNMMIDTAYDPAYIVSFSAWSTEIQKMDSIASMAANLTLLIPILAVYVTRMGEGGFLHIAGSLMAANQNAVASAASEQASGGQSYDNSSTNNSNRNNVNENKYDDSRQFVSGTNSGINSDGSMQKILPNGQVITVGGAGSTSSVGEASYRGTEGISTSLHDGRREEIQITNSEMASLAKTQESLISQEASAMATIAENTRTENGYNIDDSTDQSKEFVETLQTIDRMTEGNEYTWTQNAEAYLKSNVSLGGKIANFLGIDVGAGAEVRAGNASQQQNGSTAEVSEGSDTHNRNSLNTRSSEHQSSLESYGLDKSQQNSMRETHNKATRLEKSISTHKDNIEGYNKGIDHVKNNNAEFNKDMTQEVIHAYKETYGVSDQEAGKAVLNGDANAQKVFRQISGEKADAVLQQIKQTESSLNNSNSTDEFMQKNEHEVNKKPGAAGGEVDRFKQDNGMMPEADVVRLLNESKVTMGKTVKDNKNFTSDMYEDAQDINKFKLKNRKSDIAKLEDDRMGNGVISKFIGGAANFLTLGNAGGGIGRPSYVPISYNTQTDSTSDTYSTVRTLPNSIALRPSEGGFRSQDLANTQSLLDQFNPDNNSPDNKGESVDSTKVRKS